MWHWVRSILPLVASLWLTPRGKLKQQPNHFWLGFIRNLLLIVRHFSSSSIPTISLNTRLKSNTVVDGVRWVCLGTIYLSISDAVKKVEIPDPRDLDKQGNHDDLLCCPYFVSFADRTRSPRGFLVNGNPIGSSCHRLYHGAQASA